MKNIGGINSGDRGYLFPTNTAVDHQTFDLSEDQWEPVKPYRIIFTGPEPDLRLVTATTYSFRWASSGVS
jgi:hypothetical protein